MSHLLQAVTPSDRMTILRELLLVPDCIVLEYGPMGTTCFLQRHLRNEGLDTARLLCTHLDENDVVFGDMSKLELAILDIDHDFQPRAIFIVPSTILAVTGADVKGVCHALQPQISAKLIVCENAGFLGGETEGIEAVRRLLKELSAPC